MKEGTVEEWVRHCAAAMDAAGAHFGHGTDNAVDEAAWLVLSVLGAPLDGSFADWDRRPGREQAAAIERLLRRRVEERLPLAYLLGEAWFCGLAFEAGPGALVPRSPIAELIPGGLAPWTRPSGVRSVLDLCTGGGCIAIAMAVYQPGWRVDAADLSPEALALAERNVARHRVGDRVTLVESDLFSALGGRCYDLIVTNPPYVPAGTVDTLPEEYAAEPVVGLRSGDDGLDLPLAILAQAPAHLEPAGVLICEVGESRPRLEAALPGAPMTWIEFAHGGDGVFTMTRNELVAAADEVRAALENRNNVR